MNLEAEIEKLHPHSEQHAALCELLLDLREVEDKTKQLIILLPHNEARYRADLERVRHDIEARAERILNPRHARHD